MTQRFRVRLERPEGFARGTFIRVPQRVMDAFAPQLRVPVVVTINGYSWRITIAPYGEEFFVPVRAAVCASIGADAGDTVDVAMDRDAGLRKADVPTDLARALDVAGARAAFHQLAFTHQKELAQSVATAKRPETRQKRIDAAIAKVRANAGSGDAPRRPRPRAQNRSG
jgi:glucose/arabinose dehydrogenase